jgi:hypothetical protein
MFGGLRGEGARRGRFSTYLLERNVNFLSHINRNSARVGCGAEFEPAGVYISNLFPIHRAFCRREAELREREKAHRSFRPHSIGRVLFRQCSSAGCNLLRFFAPINKSNCASQMTKPAACEHSKHTC